LVYTLVAVPIWALAVWYLATALRRARKTGRVRPLSTFMWAERDENPTFYRLGLVQIVGFLIFLVGIPLAMIMVVLGLFLYGLNSN